MADLAQKPTVILERAPSSMPTTWPVVKPDEAGFASDLADKLDAGIRSGLLQGLHSVLVARKGRLVLERYYEGSDESWGAPLGTVAFNAETRIWREIVLANLQRA